MAEAVLPLTSLPQPSPPLVEGGDCSACALGGLLGLPVERVYDDLYGVRQSASRHEVVAALWKAQSAGLVDRFIDDVPVFLGPPSRAWFGPHPDPLAWFGYVSMALDAGFYGVASVDFSEEGPLSETDHVVLFRGWRERSERISDKASRVVQEILVSCSARYPDGRWIERDHLLDRCGGYNAIWVRPSSVSGHRSESGGEE